MKKILCFIATLSVFLFASCVGTNSTKEGDKKTANELSDEMEDNTNIEPEGETYDPEAKSSKKLDGKVYVDKYEAFANEVISKLEKAKNTDAKVMKELEMDILKFRSKNELNMDSVSLDEMRRLGEIHLRLEEALNKVEQK